MPKCVCTRSLWYVDMGHLIDQLVNVVIVVTALAIYIWRQLYQSRKYQGMLHQRVHGGPQVRRNRTR